jgi:hypothetical protein
VRVRSEGARTQAFGFGSGYTRWLVPCCSSSGTAAQFDEVVGMLERSHPKVAQTLHDARATIDTSILTEMIPVPELTAA